MKTIEIPISVSFCESKYNGSLTERNLWQAFAMESLARNKYSYFASVAKKAGYEQISEIFSKTADNEKEHAKIWFKELEQIPDLRGCLVKAAVAEHEEWSKIYVKMAEDAKTEGYEELAKKFYGVADIEKRHEEIFHKLLCRIDTDEIFTNTGIVMWECRNCGHVTISMSAPETCPVCDHPQGFFQLVKGF